MRHGMSVNNVPKYEPYGRPGHEQFPFNSLLTLLNIAEIK